jgi:hypothetical protein
MTFNNTYAIAVIVAGGIIIATTMTSDNRHLVESRLDECQRNLAALCVDTTAVQPDSCASGQCDGTRKTGTNGIQGTPA